MWVHPPGLPPADLSLVLSELGGQFRPRQPETSEPARARVLTARNRQRERGGLNATLSSAALRERRALDAAGTRLIADAVDGGGMSARGVHLALRVARTIADLAGEERASAMRLAEALHYRAYEARKFAAR